MQPNQEQLTGALHAAQLSADLSAAESYLERQGILTFGIEHIDDCPERELSYVNLGETYQLTIVQKGEDFAIASWGGWLEEAENEHCEANGETRCGYCGEFTPTDSEDWHDTVCQHCGRYVDSGEKPAPRKVCEYCEETDCDCEDN